MLVGRRRPGPPHEGDRMKTEQKQARKQEKGPEPKRSDETIEDLEPEKTEGEAVKGGVSIPYEQIKYEYKQQ